MGRLRMINEIFSMKIKHLFPFLILLIGSCNSPTSNSTQEQLDIATVQRLLDSIHIEDQKYRNELSLVREQYGRNSREWALLVSKMNATDESNLEVLEKILAQHGWLSEEQIGKTANITQFLVIQHSDLEVQEKYLPIMKQAVREGKADARSLALLIDRVNLRKGELQVYGSQVGTDPDNGEQYVLPVIEPERINERRASVGLPPIEEYISHWNLNWDLEDYKKKLPARIQILKETKILK